MIVCDLCGSDKARHILDSANLDGPLMRCSVCGLYYVGSKRFQLAFGTESPEIVVERVRQANCGFQNLRLEEEHRLAVLNARWRLEIIRGYCSSGRLLEVGCARGDFLSVARESFNVYGVEPNPELAEGARRIAPIHQGLVETLPDEDFDVAVSFHVIEHVDSPKRFIRAIAQRVRPGGFVVIETPNIESFPFRLFRSRWREFIPEHYYFFSPKTIRQLMEAEGLKMERALHVGKHASVELILNRLGRYSGLFSPLATLAQRSGLSSLTFKIDPRDIMLVVAKK
jgi:2-polyprenyl-3-methyl-5-hydroxy-6-metoxy-1,4-benzoquinol methylase